MKNSLTPKLIAMTASLAAALAASHFLIYKALLVPRLPSLGPVSPLWWLAVAAPVIIVCVYFGSRLRAWWHLITFAAAAGLVIQAFRFLMARRGEPGYIKGYETAVEHWTVLLALAAIGAGVLLSIGMLLAVVARQGTRPD